MEETLYATGELSASLVDIDLAADGSWVGVSKAGRQQVLYFAGNFVPLPVSCRAPLVRAIGSDRLIVADAAPSGDEKNAWIVRKDGRLEVNFRAGAYIEDMVVFEQVIAMIYSDHAFGRPERLDGIVFFDYGGQLQHHHSELDCYCACALDPNHLLTILHPGFPLTLFNLSTYRKTILDTPESLASASAMTCAGDVVFFYATYADPYGIYRWHVGDPEARRVAEYSGELIRGLPGGRFLAYGFNGYTILSLLDEV